jgi:two-component system NtrC family response regulator
MKTDMSTILVIDDDAEVRETMESLVVRQGHSCLTAGSLAEARARLASPSDVVFLDIRLPDGDGLSLLPELKEAQGAPEVIILTGQGDPDGAELAIQGGVWDYLVKPSSVKDIGLTLKRALAYREEKRGKALPAALSLDSVVGVSPAMQELFERVAQAAASEAGVLLTGETGTGKERLARLIHANSRRAEHEFVVVDCASLTESLLESTLFGHKKGAFTGAQSDRPGLVKLADLGTLFLDEVGELPLSAQRAFLRVLQERRFRPVGETREVASDFRLISATNRDLADMVAAGRFREDLFFRLKTIHLNLPPLRERREDLQPLATHQVERLCERYGLPPKSFAADFFEVLACYDWPGNVRELFNVLERAVVAAGRESTLYSLHLPHEIRVKAARAQIERCQRLGQAEPEAVLCVLPGDETLPTLRDYKSQAEKTYLAALITRTAGDVGRMVDVSGLSRSHLYALLKKYEMTP